MIKFPVRISNEEGEETRILCRVHFNYSPNIPPSGYDEFGQPLDPGQDEYIEVYKVDACEHEILPKWIKEDELIDFVNELEILEHIQIMEAEYDL